VSNIYKPYYLWNTLFEPPALRATLLTKGGEIHNDIGAYSTQRPMIIVCQ